MVNKTLKSIYDLEYNEKNNAETIQNLNQLLASYQIFSLKVRSYYWNVLGPDYFVLRGTFRDLHKNASETIDAIAERIRIYGQTPVYLLKDIAKMSIIEENDISLANFEMVKDLVKDLLSLIAYLEITLTTAMENGDHGTVDMTRKIFSEMERDHRNLISCIK